MVDNQVSSLQNIEQKVDSILKCLSTGNLNSVVTEPFDDGLTWPLENKNNLRNWSSYL